MLGQYVYPPHDADVKSYSHKFVPHHLAFWDIIIYGSVILKWSLDFDSATAVIDNIATLDERKMLFRQRICETYVAKKKKKRHP